MGEIEILKDYKRFLQILSMSGGISSVALPKVFGKIEEIDSQIKSKTIMESKE